MIKLFNNGEMIDNVISEYRGNIALGREAVAFIIFIICLIGVLAVVCAFVGIKSMEKQYESAWPFRLAIAGLIGTAIPSVSLLIFWLVSFNHFMGKMSIGAYIFVTPIAMIIACINVTNKHRLTQEELAIQREASKYIRPAGDL